MRSLASRYRRLATLAQRPGRLTVTAFDRLTGVTRVLKLAHRDSAEAALLQAEAERLRVLCHPGVVQLSDRYSEARDLDGHEVVTGFATPWVAGAPLGRQRASEPLARRLEWFGQLVEAVGALHRAGLLHLDLKPDNVLAAPTGVTLLDLGTARPTDSGPGSAGGTLGYAAPEVLLGQAADPRADVYSLGALLYELLCGESPYAAASAAELRRAVLVGDHVPLAAWGLSLPDGLSELVRAMLATAPGQRPAGVEQVAARLVGLGIPVPAARGEPSWIDRHELVRRAERRLDKGEGLCLVGPLGSGRRRLARWLCTDARRPALDLSGEADPLALLGRLAVSRGADVPIDPADPGWFQAVREALAQGGDEPGVVFLGCREALPPQRLRVLDMVASALASGGAAVLWAASAPVPGLATVEVGPLLADEAAELARWYGVVLPAAWRAAFQRVGGWVGRLCWALAPQPTIPADLSAPARKALDWLSGLPEGVPPVVLDALPDALRGALAELVERGLARWRDDGALDLTGLGATIDADPALRALLAEVLARSSLQLDPVWAGLLRARLGMGGPLPVDLPALSSVPASRHDELRELLQHHAARGEQPARARLLHLLSRQGDDQAVLECFAALASPTPFDRTVYARSLRRMRRYAEASEVLDALLAEPEAPERAWTELGQLSLETQDLDRARDALDRWIERGVTDEVPLRILQARLAEELLERGKQLPGMDEAIDWALARLDDPGIEAAALSSYGRIACHLGRTQVGLRLLQHAARRADEAGAVVAAAGIRMNRAAALERLGRLAEARRGYEETIRIADRSRTTQLRIMARYNLARLELRAGRLPAAEARIAEYERLAVAAPSGEVQARGALNRAWLALLQHEPATALETLAGIERGGVSPDAIAQLGHLQAWALLDLGRPEEVLTALDEAEGTSTDVAFRPIAVALRGRAFLALGRRQLDAARALLPDPLDPGMEATAGEVLLAWGGEDADPERFFERREALERATRYLRGPQAARAARLRERMLASPGAALDQVVALTEAMHDPRAFPQALASLVREALGAHRVLIMLRLPGLGHQLGYTELSGAQAAGIGREVLERIKSPSDVWVARDAFADPQLRESSQTVQTFELKSLLAVAIPRGDQAIGALYIDDMFRANRFDDDDVALLQRLARAVGSMVPLMRTDGGAMLEAPEEVLGIRLADRARMSDLRRNLDLIRSLSEANVLLTGPTGSGKSHLADRLAREVMGLNGVEVVVLRKGDPQMLITQLIGSRRGDFTGAVDREGAIARCHRDRKALFLDEIQNLDDAGQQTLLPLLDLPRSFGGLTATAARLGHPLQVMLGTNHDVRGERAFTAFRTDLWFRMSRIHIHLPPLAERGQEVVYQYLADMLARRELPAPEQVFETSALFRVSHATWPGNLRQLDAFADRAAHHYAIHERPIAADELGLLGLESPAAVGEGAAPEVRPAATLEGVTLAHVMTALRRHEWVQKHAAEELGMNPPALHKLLKRHGLLDEVRRRRQLVGA